MAKAIETGLPKMRIEEAAARRQAAIDSGRETIVGVNKHVLGNEPPLEILEVDNTAVREAQIKRLNELKAARDQAAVARALDALTAAARDGQGNLLELAVTAAQARATLGEISAAMEKVFGRHQAVTRTIAGVYRSEFGASPEIEEVRALTDAFAVREGRRPRIYIAKLGQDGHDRGAKVVATAYADFGFDVDIGPLFQTPEEAARQAVENDVHVLGMSSLAAGHRTLLPQLVAELRRLGRPDIMVVCGVVIPAQDHDALRSAGVAAIFGPGAKLPAAGREIMRLLNERLGHA
jgi:methylmalonyl-CoA mutase